MHKSTKSRVRQASMVAVLAAACALAAESAWAVTNTWTGLAPLVGGKADTSWTSAGNWDVAPVWDGTADLVLVTASTTPATLSVNSISWDTGGGTGEIRQWSQAAYLTLGSNSALPNSGNFTIAGTGIREVVNNFTLSTGTVGTWNMNGGLVAFFDGWGQSGVIDGGGGFIKTGNAELRLMGHIGSGVSNRYSEYSGGTTLAGGKITTFDGSTFDLSGNLASGPLGIGKVTLQNGIIAGTYGDQGHFWATGASGEQNGTIYNAIVLDGAGIQIGENAAYTYTFAGTAALNSSSTVNTINTAVFAKGIGENSAGLALTKTGAGTMIINAASTYSGGTFINAGKVLAGANNALPTVGTVTLGSGATNGTLDLNGFSQQVAGLAVGAGATAASQTIGNGSTTADAQLIYNGGSTSFAGIIKDAVGTGTRKTSLTVAGGTLNLAGANTYTGGTFINAGKLQAGANNVLPLAGRVTMGTSTSDGTLDLNGNSVQIGSLAVGTGATAANQIIGNSSTSANAILVYGGPSASTFAGAIHDTIGTGTMNTGLTVASGSLTLAGANTYTGPTTINNAATLAVSGSLGATPVTVNTGGRLVGPGTLTLHNTLTLNTGSIYNWELSAAGGDTIQINGDLNAAGGPIVHLVNLDGTNPVGKTYILATYTGNLTGNAAWTIDSDRSMTTSTLSHWTGGAGTVNWDNAPNWDSGGWANGTISYVGKTVQLSGLTIAAVTPGSANDVTIAPAGVSVAVTGPAAPTTIKSLTLGDGSAKAHGLTLQSGGALTALNLANILGNASLDATAAALNANQLASAGTTTLGTATITQDLTVTGGTLGATTSLNAASLNANGGATTLAGMAAVPTINVGAAGTLNLAANVGTTTTSLTSLGTTNLNSGVAGTIPTVQINGGTTTINSGTAALTNINVGASGALAVAANLGATTSTLTSAGTTSFTASAAGTIATFTQTAGTSTFAPASNMTLTAGNFSGGTTNLNGTSAVPAAAILAPATVNIGGALTTTMMNTAGATSFGSGAAGAITALNVTGGTTSFDSAATTAVATLTSTGGTTTINNNSIVAVSAQVGGTVNLNGTVTTLSAQGGTINATGPNARATTANFNGGGTITASAANPLAVASQLNTTAVVFNWTPAAGAAFTVSGADIGNDSAPRTLTLPGGTLAPAAAAGLGVHWASYAGGNVGNAPSGDGAPGYPIATWNNLNTTQGMALVPNIVDNTGATTPVSTRLGSADLSSSAYGKYGTGSSEPLLNGAGGVSPLATQITGIPYSSYKIILFVNNYGNVNGSAWVGTQTGANPGTPTYYYNTTGASTTFLQCTNTTNTTYTAGNYVIFDGLSGTDQTLWVTNMAYSPIGGNWATNTGGFEIINTAPATVNLPATALSATASSTLDLSSTPGATLGGLTLSNSGTTLTIAGTASASFASVTAAGVGSAPGASITGTAPLTITGNLNATAAADVLTLPAVQLTAATVHVNNAGAGKVVFAGTTSLGGGASDLAVDGGTAQFDVALIANGASVAGGAKLAITPTNTPNTAASTSVLSSLTIAGSTGNWSGQLDMGNNSLVIKNGGAAVRNTVADEIRQGMGLSTTIDPGHHGITSSTALTNVAGDTTLGYAVASDIQLTGTFAFAGQTVGGNDVLVKYTWKADANLDGIVNVADLGILATNYGLTDKSWVTADFNGDGLVNVADLGLLATYYGRGTSPSQSLLSFQDAMAMFPQFGGTGSVPEPTSLGLLGLGAVGLLTRRRRK